MELFSIRIQRTFQLVSTDLFEPIHTFEIESVAQRTQGAEQQEQHDFIHLFVFLN